MRKIIIYILILSLLLLPSSAFANQQSSDIDPYKVQKVKLKLDKNNKAVYEFSGGLAEIQIEDGPVIQVTSRYKKILEDGTKQTVNTPTTVDIQFVPYDGSSKDSKNEQAKIMAASGWNYLGYYSITDRPRYWVGGQGDYISANLVMDVDKYRDSYNNTTMAFAAKETRNYYTRSSTKIGAFDFKIKTYQYGQTINDGIPLSFSYTPYENDPGSSYSYLSWGTTYKRDATSSGYYAYAGWTPVILDASSSFNIAHSNSFTYSYNGNYQGVIDEDNCELKVKAGN